MCIFGNIIEVVAILLALVKVQIYLRVMYMEKLIYMCDKMFKEMKV